MDNVKDRRAWAALEVEVARRGAKIIDKDSSVLMKALFYVSLMFLWNPKFLTSFATAGLGRIWIPKRWRGTENGWTVLAHEIVHLDQAKRGAVWHTLAYAFPQILAPLGFLGFLGLLWWPLYFLFALFPLFLLPIFPAWGRIDREMEAWVTSVALDHHIYRTMGLEIQHEGIAPYYVDSLLGGAYFWAGGVLRSRLRQQLIDDLLRRAADPLSWPPITLVARQSWK